MISNEKIVNYKVVYLFEVYNFRFSISPSEVIRKFWIYMLILAP
jgi:hypothetical protein